MANTNFPDYPGRALSLANSPPSVHGRFIWPASAEETTLTKVMLADGWSELVQDATLLGEIAFRTQHPAAVIVGLGQYPRLDYPPDRVWAANPDRKLALDFSCWKEVTALQETGVEGDRFSVEVYNHEGQNVHSLLLPIGADLEWFRKLVLFYGSSEQCKDAVSTLRAVAPWQSKLNQRATWLGLVPKIERHLFPLSALATIFFGVQKQNLRVLAGVYNDAVIQRQLCLFEEIGWNDNWIWARGMGTGVRVSLAHISALWCVGGECACCGENRWTMEAYDFQQRLAFTLQAGSDQEEPHWREIVFGSLAGS